MTRKIAIESKDGDHDDVIFSQKLYVIRVNYAWESEIGCTGSTASCDRRVIFSVKA